LYTENHFTATGLVFNSNKEILMIYHKKLNVWLPPGGHIEPNELPDIAVLREVLEETGIKADLFRKKIDESIISENCKELQRPFAIFLEDIDGFATHNHIDMIYICLAKAGKLVPQQLEIGDIGWFSIERLVELKTFENVKKIALKALSYMEKNHF
jgi:8-oxo-dGTP diphosphatase